MKYPKSGRFNLKGKKIKKLSCGCCEIINRKEEILDKIMKKELEDELRETFQ